MEKMEKIVISHIGLSHKDKMLFRTLVRLDETWFGNFQLATAEGTTDGQILVADIDSLSQRQAFLELKSKTYFERIIIISKSKIPLLSDAIHLARPIVFRRLSEALKKATQFDHIEAHDHHEKNILVVDDNLPVRTFMKQKLHEMLEVDAGVDVAESGEEALVKMARENYDLVFMDVMMTGMDGYQACRQIKAMSQAKVIMLTSKSSTINRVKAKISGCDGYITKPPEDHELAQVIRRYLMKKQSPSMPLFTTTAAYGR